MKREYIKPEIAILDLNEDIMAEITASEVDPFGDEEFEFEGL